MQKPHVVMKSNHHIPKSPKCKRSTSMVAFTLPPTLPLRTHKESGVDGKITRQSSAAGPTLPRLPSIRRREASAPVVRHKEPLLQDANRVEEDKRGPKSPKLGKRQPKGSLWVSGEWERGFSADDEGSSSSSNMNILSASPTSGVSAGKALEFLKKRGSSATYKRFKSQLMAREGSLSNELKSKFNDDPEPVYDDLILATAKKMYKRRQSTCVPTTLSRSGSKESVVDESQPELSAEVNGSSSDGLTSSQELDLLFGENQGIVKSRSKRAAPGSNGTLDGNGTSTLKSLESLRHDSKELTGDHPPHSKTVDNIILETGGILVSSDAMSETRAPNLSSTRKPVSFVDANESIDPAPWVPAVGVERFREATAAVIDGLRNTRAMVSGFNMTPSTDILDMSTAIMNFLSRLNSSDTFRSFSVETFVPDDVRRALNKQPQERTDADVTVIQSHITKMRGLQRLPLKVQKQLSRVMVLETREASRIIYKQGHHPSSSYAVLTGCICLVRTMDAPSDASTPWDKRTFRLISEHRSGDAFGTHETQTDLPRLDTAICKERTELVRIDKWDYQEAVEDLANKEEKEKLDLIREHGVFKTLIVGTTYLNRHTEVVTFPPNVTVFGPNEGDGYVYILKSGICRVVRNVDFIKTSLPNGTFLLKYDEKKETYLEANEDRVSKLLVVETLSPGAFFGEEQLEIIRDDSKKTDEPAPIAMNPPVPNKARRNSMVLVARLPSRRQSIIPPQSHTAIPIPSPPPPPPTTRTIITNDRCEILRMLADDFARIATDATVTYLRGRARSGPSEAEAAHEYLRMREWGMHKRKVIREVVGLKG
ncbi:uncharacterized protein SPPG_07054 [Spizellomyces punctatus DAOM BR117]|uniref:Cyclic nucleotide-binding domain-containing protein n=1 Tax=Spizellomyces punctatus (strain DAOM BR117) TaxID=645134 RepID=A0A0L0H8S7_SPIPD|nr:uncharacterized protein SPPG_07054 [Spizellomyces punctatus DAOM BR117]KNC97582.1 hypothetical protein SPPG_07054 [Spizellomyces punctatus DAOM BR117]|eukprot:XP_016605622.1 hypothetical protein SPPG_07054 [Spizellomyces punctatus DAOM BR117]